MAAGTVISGGFPGRVAQEVQPNPKCNGCLHYDGQAGRTGACTIGLRPWLCGDGEAADIGYAPLVRGAGTYLPGMSNRSAQAPEVGPQEVDKLDGSGSHRPVTFQQVSLGEEHVHFVKSFISQHTSMQKSMCRLCQSSGMTGMAPANVGYQLCTCSPIEAYTVAKALVPRLSNLERSVIDLSDLIAFVYDASKAGFNPRMMKGTFYHAHGKYDVSPAGGGSQHVDFHPKGGGPAARVGTYGSHREARMATKTHAQRFAQGSTPQQKESAAVEIAPGWHALAGEHAGRSSGRSSTTSEGKTGVHTPKARGKSIPSLHDAKDVRVKSEDLDDWDPLDKGPRRQSVASAPEVPTTEKPYQTRFKRPNDSAKPESPKPSSGFNIDTSKLRARGEAGAKKLMQQNTPRGTDDHGARVGREAFATRTEHKAPRVASTPSPNRPGQNRPEFGGDGPKPAAPKPAAQVASKPAAPKHIDMEEGMSEADKRVRPIAQVPSMSTMPKKEEREMPRVSYKSVDETINAITKAVDEIEKSLGILHEAEHGTYHAHAAEKTGQKIHVSYHPGGKAGEHFGTFDSVPEARSAAKHHASQMVNMEKAINDTKHSHIVTGKLAPNGRGASSRVSASRMVDKLDNQYGGYSHTVKPNPNYKPPGGTAPAPGVEKSLDALLEEMHNEEDVEKSLRWSHKTQGEASTSHGKYTVHHDAATGHHIVTYKPKGSDKGSQAKFKSHREALGALVEHHIKNRPPPKPRKKKDPNAPKAPKGAGGPCPPCP